MPSSISRTTAATASRSAPHRGRSRRRWWLPVALLLAAVLIPAPRLFFLAAYGDAISDAEQLPVTPFAIVFGAGIRADGSATTVLEDRVATAAALYRQGTVGRLLLTGDGQSTGHDEPAAMRAVALALGVPAEAIVVDPGGSRTFTSCARARQVFGVERAVLVTQDFHLPRALYLCDQLGMTVIGVAAGGHGYSRRLRLEWQARELLASAGAWWDITMLRPR